MDFLKSNKLFLAALIGFWLLFCYLRIGMVDGPFQGMGDYAGWEYSGYYIYENLVLSPFPSLSFQNNIHFYPTGISPIFMSWGLERDYFYALCLTLFGQGPWLPIYYALSCLFLCLTLFFLCAPRLGKMPSMLLSVFVTFFNAYATHKFPGHFGLAIHHWATLSIAVDYFILSRVVEKKIPSLRLILFRILCTLGSLGLELGYVGGVSLTSGVLLCLATLFYLVYFYKKDGKWTFSIDMILEAWKKEASSHKKTFALLIAAILFYSFWILSLLICIMKEVKLQQSPDLITSGWHTSLFRPLIPTILPIYQYLTSFIKDNPEGYFAGSTGLSIFILAATSFFFSIKAKRHHVIYLLIFFFLLITLKPTGRSFLALFPWHAYARVGSRMTVFYPILLGLMICGFPWWQSFSSKRIKQVFFLIVGGLFLAEVPMFFSNHIKSPRLESVSEEFLSHMQLIKETKGEAIFDFPFCYGGGNGGGFCKGDMVAAVWANRKFHGKKVLGTNFGRLLHKYSDFYKPYGLHQLMEIQESRCLEEKELLYLKSFFESYDFCCMNLYADLIPKGCIESFFTVFGQPDKTVKLDGFGQTHFFYKKNPIFPQEKGLSLPLYRWIDTLSDLKSLLPFDQILTDTDTKTALMPFQKWINSPVVSEVPATEQPVLIIKRASNHLPDVSDASLVFEREDVQIYYQSSLLKKQVKEKIDLFPLFKKQGVQNALDAKYNEEDSSVFIHPSNNIISTISLNHLPVDAGDYLSFKIKMDHDQGHATFRIFAGEKKIFEHTMKSKMTSQLIRLPLDGMNAGLDLRFEIDPDGPCDYDWTSVIEPKVVSFL